MRSRVYFGKRNPLLNEMLTQKSKKGDYIEFSTFTLKVPRLFTALKKLFTRTRFSLRAQNIDGCVGSFSGNLQKPPFINKDKSIKTVIILVSRVLFHLC